jgi:large repetitive protein
VSNTTTSITVKPTTSDPTATLKVNGTAVTSGTASASIPLSVGQNTITTVVTAQDGITTKTYTITVTRAPSTNAYLSFIGFNHGTLSPAFVKTTSSYTESLPNIIDSIEAKATTNDPTATIKINGIAAVSGTYTANIGLNAGANTITIVVTAQDGVTTMTYTVTITRAAPPAGNSFYQPISISKPINSVTVENDGVVIHQAVSPNGDGINDFLTIEGITAYPDNKLLIVDRDGVLVYETRGYDNGSRVFDGHSSINGRMQLPGTYFYSLAYKVKGMLRYKNGFIVLKY